MKRRIALIASLVGVASVAVGAAGASAAAPAAGKKLVLHCAMNLTVAPPPGNPAVQQPPAGGWQYGHALCPKAGFGAAGVASPFTVPVTDDMVGKYVLYFAAGTIRGTFNLVPQEGDLSNFLAENWLGTTRVISGTGIYKGIRGLKAPGTMSCSSPDTVHMTCTMRDKVLAPPTA